MGREIEVLSALVWPYLFEEELALSFRGRDSVEEVFGCKNDIELAVTSSGIKRAAEVFHGCQAVGCNGECVT